MENTGMVSRQHRRKAAQVSTMSKESEPLAIIGTDYDRHIVHQRLPSANETNTRVVRILEPSKETIIYLRRLSSQLDSLDMSNLHLKKIPDDLLTEMSQLTKLNLSNNDFADEAVGKFKLHTIKTLLEINLCYNRLTVLPAGLSKLGAVTRVYLSHNKITAIDGIEKLRQLKILILDHNKLERLPDLFYKSLRRLEILILANNRIKSISSEIKYLKHLTQLDLTSNQLHAIPSGVFLLPALDFLDLSFNKLIRVPTLNVNKKRTLRISDIDLSNNFIRVMPDFLMKFTDKLDISNNKINAVTYRLLRHLDGKCENQAINLQGNLIKNIPQEICDGGLRLLTQRLSEMQMAETVYQGFKIHILGNTGSGKTSLVQSLLDDQSCLVDEKTTGVDIYDHVVQVMGYESAQSKTLKISFWDFAGDECYRYPQNVFLQENSLVIITFNMATYGEHCFQEKIGYWLKLVLAKFNDIKILLVATFIDEVSDEGRQRIIKQVKRECADFFENRVTDIENERKNLEKYVQYSPGVRDYLLKHCQALLNFKRYIHPTIVMISSKTFQGFDELQKEITQIAQNKVLFPNVLEVVPSLFKDAELMIEAYAGDMKLPFVTMKKFRDIISRKYALQGVIDQLASYLHANSKIFWLKDHAELGDVVILNPSWFAEVVRQFFRHDFKEFDFLNDGYFKEIGMKEEAFRRLHTEAVNQGIVDFHLLSALFVNLVPVEHKQLYKVVHLLTDRFLFGFLLYPTVELSNEQKRKDQELQAMETDDDNTVRKVHLPWLMSDAPADNVRLQILELSTLPGNEVHIITHDFYPEGLLHRIISRLLTAGKGWLLKGCWKSGILMYHEKTPFFVTISVDGNAIIVDGRVKQINNGEEEPDNENIEVMSNTFWTSILPLIKYVEQELATFPGLWVKRCVRCPACAKPGFFAEWNSPKEMQDREFAKCRLCDEDVPTSFLVQPKEKKKIAQFMLQRIRQTQERATRRSNYKMVTTAPRQHDVSNNHTSTTIVLNDFIPHYPEMEFNASGPFTINNFASQVFKIFDGITNS